MDMEFKNSQKKPVLFIEKQGKFINCVSHQYQHYIIDTDRELFMGQKISQELRAAARSFRHSTSQTLIEPYRPVDQIVAEFVQDLSTLMTFSRQESEHRLMQQLVSWLKGEHNLNDYDFYSPLLRVTDTVTDQTLREDLMNQLFHRDDGVLKNIGFNQPFEQCLINLKDRNLLETAFIQHLMFQKLRKNIKTVFFLLARPSSPFGYEILVIRLYFMIGNTLYYRYDTGFADVDVESTLSKLHFVESKVKGSSEERSTLILANHSNIEYFPHNKDDNKKSGYKKNVEGVFVF